MTEPRLHRALVTCPWCDWREELEGEWLAELTERGIEAAKRHNLAAGHDVKPGSEPRPGYYRGEPIA